MGDSDSFVNSQEWTLSRSVSDLKLGVLGGLSSGKTALVHRYLTGSYMQEESPEGGRFKKEVVIDGHSLLLLIRDEGGPPDQQFSHWVDGVIFVFSLNDEISFNAVYEYYAKLAYYRNTADIPLILVGTQDAISDKRPRVIDDLRAKKLAHDLKRCTYYETCATYGLNVERVFREACTKIIQQRIQSQMAMASPSPGLGVPVPPPVGSCPTTPGHHSQQGVVGQRSQYPPDHNHSHHHGRSQSATVAQRNGPNSNSRCSPNQLQNSSANVVRAGGQNLHNSTPGYFAVPNVVPAGALYQQQQYLSESHRPLSSSGGSGGSHGPRQMTGISPTSSNQSISSVQNQNQTNHQMVQQNNLGISQGGFDQETRFFPRQLHSASSSALRTPGHGAGGRLSSQPSDFAPADFGDGPPACPVATPGGHGTNQGPTPMSTPTSQRKNRRISNIFRGPKDKENHHDEVKFRNGELGLGSGRAIPSKQGHLYKRSTKGALNKEWKKKYVCLCSDGTLAYYPNLRDYMEDSNGKKIELRLTTVKVPGQQIPKGAQRSHTQPITSVLTPGQRSLAKENSFPDLNARILNGGLAAQASRSGSGGSAEKSERVTLTSFEPLKDDLQLQENSGEEATTSGKSTEEVLTPSVEGKKKRHHLRRVAGGGEPEEGEFIIVSSDQKKWYFSAANDKERDEWVGAITDEIGRCLQDQSGTGRGGGRPMSARNPASCCREEVQTLRSLPGNELCADCGAENPEWASTNLGIIVCIECSGVHRNLGSHISRVRSLELDDWPPSHIAVMKQFGNDFVNRVYEYNIRRKMKHSEKPEPSSSIDIKERFIRSKYEEGAYLAVLPLPLEAKPLSEQIVDAVDTRNFKDLTLLLAHSRRGNCAVPVHFENGCPECLELLLKWVTDT